MKKNIDYKLARKVINELNYSDVVAFYAKRFQVTVRQTSN